MKREKGNIGSHPSERKQSLAERRAEAHKKQEDSSPAKKED